MSSGYTVFWLWRLSGLSRFFVGFDLFLILLSCWTVSIVLRSLVNVSHLSRSDEWGLVCFDPELLSSFLCGQVADCITVLMLFQMVFVTFHIVFAIVESADVIKDMVCLIFYIIVGIFCFCQKAIKIYSVWPVNRNWWCFVCIWYNLYLLQTTENSRIFMTETVKKRLCLSFGNPILRTAVSKTCCLALLYCYISYDKTVF